MRRLRYRLVTIGLLLCVVQVWSERTCGTDFTDPASSAVLADIILEGRPRSVPESDATFNVTVQVRSIKKGGELVNGGKKPKLITLGPFGREENKHDCVGKVENRRKYLFFLKHLPGSKKYLQLSALPVKAQKRANRAIKKILCDKCAKAPSVRKIKNKRVKEGSSLKIKCSARGKPSIKFTWYKDGIALKSRKGTLRIKDGRKGSRLQISKASKRDEGEYICQASNAAGQSNVTVKVEVNSKSPHRRCDAQSYCFNGGTCRYIENLEKEFCECPEKWAGRRCELQDIFSLGPEYNKQAKLLHDRTIIFISIAIATLVFIAICIISYFLARRQRKKWEARKLRKMNKNIPETYRRLLDDVDGPSPPRPRVHRVRENSTQTDSNTEAYIPYNDPNIYPNINPYTETTPYINEVEMRRHAPPLGAAPRSSSQGYGPPERISGMSRSSSRGSRSRLKAVSLDEGRDSEDQPGMNDPNCIPMKELPRSCYSDGNIKAGSRPGHKRAPPSSMQNMDIPEGELDNMTPLNAEGPVVVDMRSSTPPFPVEPEDFAASPEEQPKSEESPQKEPLPTRFSFDMHTDSEEETTEKSPLTRLHISEDEEDGPLSGPSRDKSFDSLDLDKSDSQPTMESVVTDPGARDSRNNSEPMFTNNPDSLSSSTTGSPDSHPSSSMENLVIPVLPNGTETGLSWDEHGMPVSPRHTTFPPLSNTDNLEDQFIHPQPPTELPLSPSNNIAYQRLLKDIREDQDPIPI